MPGKSLVDRVNKYISYQFGIFPKERKSIMSTTAYQIIAVDFDRTLCYSTWPELGEPNRPLTEFLINQKRSGNKLILWKCRTREALEKAVSWCREHQLEFDAINDNLPEIVEMYGINSRKITCDNYIDDNAVLPAILNT